MFSFTVKAKALGAFATCVCKSKLTSSTFKLIEYHSQRAFITTKFLSFSKFNPNLQQPKDFGKIVSLDSFDNEDDEWEKEVKEKFPSGKKKGRNKGKIAGPDSFDNEDDEWKVEMKEKFPSGKKFTKHETKKKIKYFNSYQSQSDEEKKTKKRNKTININKIKQNSSYFRSILTELKSKKGINKLNKVILEGKRLIHSAMCNGMTPEVIFFSRDSTIQNFNFSSNVKLCKVPYKSMKLWSDVATPPGILGIFKIPDISQIEKNPNSLPLTVICDNIRDPGNLGAVIRVSAGVGCERIILSKGCAGIWMPRTLRAASGAIFVMPIVTDAEWENIESLVGEQCKVLVADNDKSYMVDAMEDEDVEEVEEEVEMEKNKKEEMEKNTEGEEMQMNKEEEEMEKNTEEQEMEKSTEEEEMKKNKEEEEMEKSTEEEEMKKNKEEEEMEKSTEEEEMKMNKEEEEMEKSTEEEEMKMNKEEEEMEKSTEEEEMKMNKEEGEMEKSTEEEEMKMNKEEEEVEKSMEEEMKKNKKEKKVKKSTEEEEMKKNKQEKIRMMFRRKSDISSNLPVFSYDSVKYTKDETVIIIGGETNGLSDEAFQFATKRKGSRVFIPMQNNIESFNTAVAFGILTSEIRRQMMRTSEVELQAESSNDQAV